jgi:hypothetical protein
LAVTRVKASKPVGGFIQATLARFAEGVGGEMGLADAENSFRPGGG